MNIARVLKDYNIEPNKNMDQYFLQDDKILSEEIKAASLKSTDIVLEVGSGLGNLTKKIAEKCKVIGIEKDYSFRNVLKGISNTNIIFGDALEVLESLRKVRQAKAAKGEQLKAEFNKIISNIPYSISQDLLIEFMRHKWNLAVLVVQKEFAEKLSEKDKLGLLLSECADIKILRQIPANAFYPEAVPSSLILVKQKKIIDYDFWLFLSEIFKDRNKDVKNVLRDYPVRLAKKKVHQLTAEEIKKLYALNRERVEGDT
jgi:16S rRNA (adenine1518-N6/adenine1519-N6)-dimethyltransferase